MRVQHGASLALRIALLASTQLAATPWSSLHAQVRATARTLTSLPDVTSIGSTEFLFAPERSPLGLVPLATGLGVDALGGDDIVSLTGKHTYRITADPFRIYLNLPSGATDVLAAPRNALSMTGVDGGAGHDRITNLADLSVIGAATFNQFNLDLGKAGFPAITDPVALDARLTVAATGLFGGDGVDTLTNSGLLTAESDAAASRGSLKFNAGDLGGGAQNLQATADATGLFAGTGGDTLINAAGGVLDVSAEALASSLDISVSGMEITSPTNATVSLARAFALRGSTGADTLTNAGTATVEARATTTEVGVAISANSISLPSVVVPENPVESNASAFAFGLAGGGGADRIVNGGALSLLADVTYTHVGFSITDRVFDLSAIDVFLDLPDAPAEPTGGAVARVTGLAGDGVPVGEGNDWLENSGLIAGAATSKVTSAAISIAVPINGMSGTSENGLGTVLDAVSIGVSDGASASTLALSEGLSGGGGYDRLKNSGTIFLGSDALAQTGQIAVDVLGFISDVGGGSGGGGAGSGTSRDFSLSFDAYNTSTLAYANSTGLNGGAGGDMIDSTGAISTAATGLAQNLDVGIAVNVSTDDQNFALSGSAVFTRIWGGADAIGIDGGGFADLIQSSGPVSAFSDAEAKSLAVNANVAVNNSGVSLDASFVDAAILADSAATGIRATDHGDYVRAGPVTARADASVSTLVVDVGVTVAKEQGLVGSGAFIRADQNATAIARGIDRFSFDPLPGIGIAGLPAGHTILAPDAVIEAIARAETDRIGIAANVAVANEGVGLGATFLELSNLTRADAAGFAGGLQADMLTAGGPISATAQADGLSSTTGVTVGAAKSGVGAGVTLISSSTESRALATGAELGGGADRAGFARSVLGLARSANVNNVNAVTVTAAENGLAIGASMADLDTLATAHSQAIGAGDGADIVTAAQNLSAVAEAEGDVVVTGVTLSGTMNGVAAGASLARTQGSALARATAANLGAGNDALTVEGTTGADAVADISTVGVGVSVAGSYQGVSAGVALLDVSGDALASAAAADGGTGDDQIELRSALDTSALSEATSSGVSVALSGAVYGVGLAGAVVMGDTRSSADAFGIDGGLGADLLRSAGGSVEAFARARRTDVAVSGSFAIGAAASGNFLDTTTNAAARAFGIAGDGALGIGGAADRIAVTGPLIVRSKAEAEGASYGIAVTVAPVGIAANVLTGGASSHALGIGLSGGDGADTLVATGAVDVGALASTRASSLSLAIGIGLNFGELSTLAEANAAGLSGGGGNDLVEAADVTTNAFASTRTSSIGIAFTGLSVADLGTAARARATGLDGGDGDDTISTTGAVRANATAATPVSSTQVALTGGTKSQIENAGFARAIGIDGGAGLDRIAATRAIVVDANATLSAQSLGISITGASANKTVSSSIAQAVGVTGGAGNDLADVTDMDARALALATAGSLNVNLVGAGLGTAGLASLAHAAGFEGGDGDDSGLLRGRARVNSVATSVSDSIGVSLTGVQLDASSARATATAALASGEAGRDRLEFAGASDGDVSAAAAAGIDSTTFTLVGGAGGVAGASARGTAEGLSGGLDADILLASRNLRVRASANAATEALGITLGGAAGSRGGVDAGAIATGFDGGAGTDTLLNLATLDAGATASGGFKSLSVSGIGLSGSIAGLGIDSQAAGMAGGSGNDAIENQGRVIASAQSSGENRASAFSLIGVSGLATAVSLSASARGLDGGDGDDLLSNKGQVAVTAAGSSSGSSLSLALLGATIQDGSSTVRGTATGMAGGLGRDAIDSAGALSAIASAVGRTTSISGQFVGGGSSSLAAVTDASATGLDGGADADNIANRAALEARATASASAGQLNVTILGGSQSTLGTTSLALATGVAGGGGNDQIANTAALAFAADASLSAIGESFTLAGAATGRLSLAGSATGVGLGGGDGDDALLNAATGSISGSVQSRLLMSANSLTLLGGSLNAGLGRALAVTTGMAGGGGVDSLVSEGGLSLSSIAAVTSTADAVTGLGAVLTAADLSATADASGLDGGDGNDGLVVGGGLSVASRATAVYTASTFTLAGVSAAQGTLGANAASWGLRGGTGANSLRLQSLSAAMVSAETAATLLSNTRVGLGAAVGGGAIAAVSRATGLEGGEGADDLRLLSALTVTARSELDLGGSQIAFAGAAAGEATGLVRATARGLNGAAGNNLLVTTGPLTVRALGNAAGSGASGASIGSTNAAAALRSELFATGLEAGTGVDGFSVEGAVTVDLGSTVFGAALVNGATLFSSGRALASAHSQFEGVGVRDLGGNGTIVVRAPISVGVRPGDILSGADQTRARAVSFGATIDAQANADSRADATSRAFLRGLWLGGGTQTVSLENLILVRNQARTIPTARADGTSVFEGHATATVGGGIFGGATVGVESAGTLNLQNSGTVLAFATPIANGTADAGANGSGFVDPDARATANVFGNGVTAVGVLASGGSITNTGVMSVISAPTVDILAVATRRGDGLRNTDGFANAAATVNGAYAWGVRLTGIAASEVRNSGTITVESRPVAIADAQATGFGRDGDALATALATANDARAIGIETGRGADLVVNSGQIRVVAAPVATARATATPSGSGERLALPTPQTLNPSWTGIVTGDGNDVIVNSGLVDARNGGIAIDSGAGDDQLWLVGTDDGPAQLNGRVFLGSGNDLLHLDRKVALDSVVDGGAGIDSLVAVGEHNLSAGVTNFESLLKTGDGVLNLGPLAWRPSLSTTVERGRLSIVSGLDNPNHVLTTTIHADGAAGAVELRQGRARLQGRIVVAAAPSATPFQSGRTWDVIRAPGGLDLSLAKPTELPASTALVKFSSALVSGTTLRVSSQVGSMSALAGFGEARSLARALDRALPSARGDVGAAIASLQTLDSAAEVRASLDRMAPRLANSSLATANAALDNTMALIAARQPGVATPAGLRFAEAGSGGRVNSWAVSFDRNPALAASGAGAGRIVGIASGWDVAVRDDLRLGFAVATQASERREPGQSGQGTALLFATNGRYAASDDLHLSGSVVFGAGRYDGGRGVIGGAAIDSAALRDRTRMFGIDTGFDWRLGTASPWQPALTGRVTYQQARSGGAREATSSGLGLIADTGRFERAEAALGLRVAPGFDLGLGALGPLRVATSLDAAFVHRLSGGNVVQARFADMPDFAFDLASANGPRSRIDWGAGLAFTLRGVSLQTSYRSRFAGPLQADELRASLTLPF